MQNTTGRLMAGIFVITLSLIAGLFLEPVEAQTTTTSVSGCHIPEQSGWEREELKGKVKDLQIEKVSHYGNRSERELVNEISFDTNGNYLKLKDPYSIPTSYRPGGLKSTFVFNSDCQPIERVGMSVTEWGKTKTVYLYENKRLKEESTYQAEKGWLLVKDVYTYNDPDRSYEKVTTIQSHPEHYRPPRYDVYITTKTVYKLDNRGNTIEETDFFPDGRVADRYVYQYNSDSRLIKKSRFDKKGQLDSQDFFKYSDTGLVTDHLEYYNECYVDTEGTFCKGNLDSGDGKFHSAAKTIYEYDRLGNWIKKTELLAGDSPRFEPFEETFRKITYY